LTIRTPEKVPMIQEIGPKMAIGKFKKGRLTIVHVAGAYIDQPGKPETFPVANTPKGVSWENLKQLHPGSPQKS
jgi:hypothetical protein